MVEMSVTEAIRLRQTSKVLAKEGQTVAIEPHLQEKLDAIVKQSIADAGMAPFHYDRHCNGLAEPWRVYQLSTDTCRTLAENLPVWFDLKSSNKLPAMLRACGCLVLVNWLPQFRDAHPTNRGSDAAEDPNLTAEKQREIDDEHLLATGAYVQNLLLLLTAAGLNTYWSSGGQLGHPDGYRRLGIDSTEKLAAAVFVEYPGDETAIAERLAGKNRDLRAASTDWSRDIIF